jgi:hypothetical protein
VTESCPACKYLTEAYGDEPDRPVLCWGHVRDREARIAELERVLRIADAIHALATTRLHVCQGDDCPFIKQVREALGEAEDRAP